MGAGKQRSLAGKQGEQKQGGSVYVALSVALLAVSIYVALLNTRPQPQLQESQEPVSGNHLEHHNAGVVAFQNGDLEAAEASYRAALRLEPTYADSAVQLALVYTNKGKPAEATAVLRAHRRATTTSSLTFTAAHKLEHDIEQLDYLQSTSVATKDSIAVYKSVLAELPKHADEGNSLTKLTPRQSAMLSEAETVSMHVPDMVDSDPSAAVINSALDFQAKEDEYLSSSTAVLDDILTPEALESLYTFCLASTMWHEPKPWGYLGAYMQTGLSHPVIFQLAHELRLRFPRIFKDHYLFKVWAYKYTSDMTGINIHGDEAAVNVNLWLTPTNASLNRASGGLVVFNQTAPSTWSFDAFNSLNEIQPGGRVDKLLRASGYANATIPYRRNRIVMFNSSLFHKTDDFSFKKGYKLRRINLTFLFGKRSVIQRGQLATQLYKQGNVLFTQGKMHEAIASYTQALEGMSDFADCYFNRAVSYLQLQQLPEARADLTRAAELNPLHADARFQLANVLLTQKQHERAAEQYAVAAALRPQQANIRYNQATCLMQMQKYEEAAQIYEAVVAISPDLASAYSNLAIAQTELLDPTAVASARTALRLRPNDQHSFVNLQRALQSFPRCLHDAPGLCAAPVANVDFIFTLSGLCADSKDFARAENCLTEAKKNANDPQVKAQLESKLAELRVVLGL